MNIYHVSSIDDIVMTSLNIGDIIRVDGDSHSYIYDGDTIISLDYSLDPSGSIPIHISIMGLYPLGYWSEWKDGEYPISNSITWIDIDRHREEIISNIRISHLGSVVSQYHIGTMKIHIEMNAIYLCTFLRDVMSKRYVYGDGFTIDNDNIIIIPQVSDTLYTYDISRW